MRKTKKFGGLNLKILKNVGAYFESSAQIWFANIDLDHEQASCKPNNKTELHDGCEVWIILWICDGFV